MSNSIAIAQALTRSWAEQKEKADLVNVRVRLDDHKPIGPHINVESVISLRGEKEGRDRIIANNHSRFDAVSCAPASFSATEKIHCW